jgi:hypothetical protein
MIADCHCVQTTEDMKNWRVVDMTRKQNYRVPRMRICRIRAPWHFPENESRFGVQYPFVDSGESIELGRLLSTQYYWILRENNPGLEVKVKYTNWRKLCMLCASSEAMVCHILVFVQYSRLLLLNWVVPNSAAYGGYSADCTSIETFLQRAAKYAYGYRDASAAAQAATG